MLRRPSFKRGIVPLLKQEMDMNRQEREIDRLSDDELDTVSGGSREKPEPPPFDFVKWVLNLLSSGPVKI
jgi:hypothetical protein